MDVLATILAVPLGAIFIQLSSYLVHRWLHDSGSKAHEEHHFALYPPLRFTTAEYLDPSSNAGLIQKLVYTAPVVTILPFLVLGFGWVPALHFVGSCLAVGKLDQYVHDAIHIDGHWLERFEWFWQRRFLHRIHHSHVELNYGICWFFVDKWFRSFQPVENKRRG